MKQIIRKAVHEDIEAVASVYDQVHQAQEEGRLVTGWIRGVYPVKNTALEAIEREDLFVFEENDRIVGAAVINQIQVDVYYGAPWEHQVSDDRICVLHTLVISPDSAGRGLGKKFVNFYEDYAAQHGCPELRMDTNGKNLAARALYKMLGYKEVSIVTTVFNGIPDVDLVLLEKWTGRTGIGQDRE